MGVRLFDHGLVIQRINFSESSLVLKVLTRLYGKQTLMARGVRKNGRNGRRAALSGFHTIDLEGQARSQTAMLVLTRADIGYARHRILHQPTALAAAQVIQEVISRLTADADPCEALFDVTSSFLDLLEDGGDPLLYLSMVLGRVIHLLGYGWRLAGCVGCGRLDNLAFFSVKRQQAVCISCGGPYAERLLPLTSEVIWAMDCLDWPPDCGTLSPHGAGLLYRIGINCLARMAGGRLLTDGPFRAMIGRCPGYTHAPPIQETADDRQRAFGNFGLSPVQGGIGFELQK
ncbi:MAG: DNA repair protein RecO [Nitrospirae bacterium]|nr:DNA repair protein RecO [Magnetococcales bacterium]